MPLCILVRDEPWCALVEADLLHDGVVSELTRVICQIDACCSRQAAQAPIGPYIPGKTRDSLERKGRKGPVVVSAGWDYDHGRLVAQSQAFSMTVVSSDVEVQHSAA